MSQLHVEVCTIDAVNEHPNADALELLVIKGWQVVGRKGDHQSGDKVVYFPPDTVLPPETSERFGVTKYLSNGSIKCTRLRGEPSFGLVVKPDGDWEVGEDVAEWYGATKWLPPLRHVQGEARQRAPQDPRFFLYTDIENLRHFNTVFEDGEEVVVTEKLHGQNARIGLIEGEWFVGTRKYRKPNMEQPESESDRIRHRDWRPVTTPVLKMIGVLSQTYKQVIVYSETFGGGVQKGYDYGGSAIQFRVFDVLQDGHFMDHDLLMETCCKWDVPTVPVLYRGPYSIDKIKELASGTSTINGARHIREGVVVRPVFERTHPKIGRVILKYVSDEYLLDNKKSDYTEE